ncbi:hypothetical protein D8I24_6716 [Cupriavidus necator H850]|nr:hypothetical protein D8I24_6716 [Cupriavidus necator H850]
MRCRSSPRRSASFYFGWHCGRNDRNASLQAGSRPASLFFDNL